MKKVLIINTGGTIGMKQTPKGLLPASGYLAEKMSQMTELHDEPMPAYDILEYDPVIDSANMTPEHWMKLANDIRQNEARYDGFVILHGTDTMAYTASALPLLLPHLAKPAILTGAQLPIGQVRNDARENLKTAMLIAGNCQIPEVGLFFGDYLFRGCRATKISATRLDAFDSPNYPPLVTAQSEIEVHTHRFRHQPIEYGLESKIQAGEIATFRLFPGMSVPVLHNLIRRPLRALILETYGLGNGPNDQRTFVAALELAREMGVIVISVTQCRHGSVNQGVYAAGKALEECDVISAGDMTIEAVITKLMYLLSQSIDAHEIRRLMKTNLVGEITVAAESQASKLGL